LNPENVENGVEGLGFEHTTLGSSAIGCDKKSTLKVSQTVGNTLIWNERWQPKHKFLGCFKPGLGFLLSIFIFLTLSFEISLF